MARFLLQESPKTTVIMFCASKTPGFRKGTETDISIGFHVRSRFRLADDSGPASISARAIAGRSAAGAPSTSDIPAGEFIVWKNTVDSTVKLYYNDSGTLKSVTLN